MLFKDKGLRKRMEHALHRAGTRMTGFALESCYAKIADSRRRLRELWRDVTRWLPKAIVPTISEHVTMACFCKAVQLDTRRASKLNRDLRHARRANIDNRADRDGWSSRGQPKKAIDYRPSSRPRFMWRKVQCDIDAAEITIRDAVDREHSDIIVDVDCHRDHANYANLFAIGDESSLSDNGDDDEVYEDETMKQIEPQKQMPRLKQTQTQTKSPEPQDTELELNRPSPCPKPESRPPPSAEAKSEEPSSPDDTHEDEEKDETITNEALYGTSTTPGGWQRNIGPITTRERSICTTSQPLLGGADKDTSKSKSASTPKRQRSVQVRLCDTLKLPMTVKQYLIYQIQMKYLRAPGQKPRKLSNAVIARTDRRFGPASKAAGLLCNAIVIKNFTRVQIPTRFMELLSRSKKWIPTETTLSLYNLRVNTEDYLYRLRCMYRRAHPSDSSVSDGQRLMCIEAARGEIHEEEYTKFNAWKVNEDQRKRKWRRTGCQSLEMYADAAYPAMLKAALKNIKTKKIVLNHEEGIFRDL